MTDLTFLDTDSPGKRYAGQWRRVVDAWLRRHGGILLAVAALWRLALLGIGELQQWDEAIYALRLRVALYFGELWDQSAHMLAGSYFSAHPPLYVWLSTFWTLLLGDAIWTHRLTSGLAGATLVFLTYAAGRKVMPASLALIAAVFVGFSPLIARYSALGQLDVLLALLMFATLYASAAYVTSGRKRLLLVAAAALGGALMTKMFFALSIPAAILVAAVLPWEHKARRRVATVAIAGVLLSLPLWLPWLWSFVVRHGQGDPMYLFSAAVPLGATLDGFEGTVKDTGMLYYVNQLTVHASVLLPFALFGIWSALRYRRSPLLTLCAAWLVLQTAVLMMTRSAFEVYLIPLIPPLFLLSVEGVRRARQLSPFTRGFLTATASICLIWSMSHDWRVAVKALTGLGRSGTPDTGTLLDAALLLLLIGLAAAMALRCVRRYRADKVFSSGMLWLLAGGFAVAALWTPLFTSQSDVVDGAKETADFVLAADAEYVALIGNGENPQLSWYLDGADIGWQGANVIYQRLEPRTLGIEAIAARLREMATTHRVLVIVELDEIAHGVFRQPKDVLPETFAIVLSSVRYVVASSGPHVPSREEATK